MARPMSPGGPQRWMTIHRDPRKGPEDKTPLTGRLTVTHTPDQGMHSPIALP